MKIMKRIGIDARLMYQTGVGTYLQNLLHHIDISETPGIEFYVYVLRSDLGSVGFTSKKMNIRPCGHKWHSLTEQTAFLFQILGDRIDLMHFTYFSYPVLYRKKFVATVHDTTPLRFRTGKASTRNGLVYAIKHAAFERVLRAQIRNSRFIITPTETVRKELAGIYGKGVLSKSRTVYEGVSYKMIGAAGTVVGRDPGKNVRGGAAADGFYIYVGNFYPHKNIERLVKSFRSVKNGNLVLLGPDDHFTGRIERAIGEDGLGEKVQLVRNPSLEELVYFYRNARALIHPSLSEGFGLPLVEALYFGCPVIASDIPVFREILGSAATYFNPRDEDDIASTVNGFREKRLDAGRNPLLKRFSFAKMARETLRIYRNNV